MSVVLNLVKLPLASTSIQINDEQVLYTVTWRFNGYRDPSRYSLHRGKWTSADTVLAEITNDAVFFADGSKEKLKKVLYSKGLFKRRNSFSYASREYKFVEHPYSPEMDLVPVTRADGKEGKSLAKFKPTPFDPDQRGTITINTENVSDSKDALFVDNKGTDLLQRAIIAEIVHRIVHVSSAGLAGTGAANATFASGGDGGGGGDG